MDIANENQKKEYIKTTIYGAIDSGRETLAFHLMFELGGISKCEMKDAETYYEARLGGPLTHQKYLNYLRETRNRDGSPLGPAVREFNTKTKQYCMTYSPAHWQFIRGVINGSAKPDVAILLVSAYANPPNGFNGLNSDSYKDAIAKTGSTYLHSLLLHLLGIKQLFVCINKMDLVEFNETIYNEIRNDTANMLREIGWSDNQISFIPISAYHGDNILIKSKNMPWWDGFHLYGNTPKVNTLYEALDNIQILGRERANHLPMRTPISGVYKIRGVGDVITGRIQQGTIDINAEVVFLPTHTKEKPCCGKAFDVERQKKQLLTGENVGINIKGLDPDNKPRVGDVMILESDKSLKVSNKFVVQVTVLPWAKKPQPLGFGLRSERESKYVIMTGNKLNIWVQTATVPVTIININYKNSLSELNPNSEATSVLRPTCPASQAILRKGTINRIENAKGLKACEVGEILVESDQLIPIDTFENSESLGLVVFAVGNVAQMVGKIISLL